MPAKRCCWRTIPTRCSARRRIFPATSLHTAERSGAADSLDYLAAARTVRAGLAIDFARAIAAGAEIFAGTRGAGGGVVAGVGGHNCSSQSKWIASQTVGRSVAVHATQWGWPF